MEREELFALLKREVLDRWTGEEEIAPCREQEVCLEMAMAPMPAPKPKARKAPSVRRPLSAEAMIDAAADIRAERSAKAMPMPCMAPAAASVLPPDLEDPEPDFMLALQRRMEEDGRRPSEIYEPAGVDRRTFSKLVTHRIMVTRETAMALTFALGGTRAEMEHMLSLSGYAFSAATLRDRVLSWCAGRSLSIGETNDMLCRAGLSTLNEAR